MKKFKSLLVLSFLFFLLTAFSLPIPEAGIFKIKKIAKKNILYTPHFIIDGHFLKSIFKLALYYTLNNDDYNVVFPIMRTESRTMQDADFYVSIGFQGKLKETEGTKITQLEGGLFASYIYKGSYINLASAIRETFQKIIKTEKFIPHNDEEIRLLFWNSIMTHYPQDLITEIQIRITPL